MRNQEVRVAMLEDQRLTLESLEYLLTANGLSVVLATGEPLEFMSALPEAKPAIALIDLYLGEPRHEGDGERAMGLRLIREIHTQLPGIGLIALSGQANEAELNAAREAGASASLDKNSIGPEQLLAAIRATLRGRASEGAVLPGGETGGLADVNRLTLRELQVLRHVATGADNLKIAALLGITERTVRAHVSALYRKLQCENRTEMAVLARTLGIRFSELDR